MKKVSIADSESDEYSKENQIWQRQWLQIQKVDDDDDVGEGGGEVGRGELGREGGGGGGEGGGGEEEEEEEEEEEDQQQQQQQQQQA